jgi:hypothetical protein
MPLKNKIATIEVIITDQGNGSSYCSNCNNDLAENTPKTCPFCGYKLIKGSIFINQGGSDF